MSNSQVIAQGEAKSNLVQLIALKCMQLPNDHIALSTIYNNTLLTLKSLCVPTEARLLILLHQYT